MRAGLLACGAFVAVVSAAVTMRNCSENRSNVRLVRIRYEGAIPTCQSPSGDLLASARPFRSCERIVGTSLRGPARVFFQGWRG